MTSYIVLLALLGISVGCSSITKRHPVPGDQVYDRHILPGVPAVRAWSGTLSSEFTADLIESVHQEERAKIRINSEGSPNINVLTLSGGSIYGAFGAGFMDGWTQSGTRPMFKVVTGISAGSIIAPFAFLGPEYDGVLKMMFTAVNTEDIFKYRGLSILWSGSLLDSAPLAGLIELHINQSVLEAVAQAHRQGRRLYIGTTNLDEDRMVVWNMGAIANSGHPKALDLFRKVILASSSMPAVFPPVFINVEVDGKTYDEMHVDGGIKAEIFLTAATVNITEIRRQLRLQETSGTRTKIFIIRNAAVRSSPKPIPRNIVQISKQAIMSLTKSQAIKDLIHIYDISQKHGFDYNWVSLPDIESATMISFNTEEMRRLYTVGYEMGLNGNAWRKEPPSIRVH